MICLGRGKKLVLESQAWIEMTYTRSMKIRPTTKKSTSRPFEVRGVGSFFEFQSLIHRGGSATKQEIAVVLIFFKKKIN